MRAFIKGANTAVIIYDFFTDCHGNELMKVFSRAYNQEFIISANAIEIGV